MSIEHVKSRAQALLGWMFIAAISLVLVLPGLMLIPMSFTSADFLTFPPRGVSMRWYREILADPQWSNAIVNSLIIATGAAAIAVVTGVPAALALRRAERKLFSDEAATALPLVVPTVVLGVGLYLWFLEQGWVGSRIALMFAHAVLGAPLVVLTVLATLRRIDPGLEDTALTLGAKRWRAVWTVTLPLAMPGIVAGGLFAFITSFDEIALAFFLADAGMKTLPKILYDQASYQLRPSLAAASTLLIVISALAACAALTSGWSRNAQNNS